MRNVVGVRGYITPGRVVRFEDVPTENTLNIYDSFKFCGSIFWTSRKPTIFLLVDSMISGTDFA